METVSEKDKVKSDNFKRLAKARTNKVLKCFKHLANLKNANYKSTPEQRNEILAAIRKGIEEVEYVWAGEKPKKENFEFREDETEE